MGMDWQPIETAPKDGTGILGWPIVGRYNEDMPAPIAWDDEQWRMIAAEGETAEPTHWMPLPFAPNPCPASPSSTPGSSL